MGKSSSRPPDPNQTAQTQGYYNQQAAIDNAALNRIDTNTPWGSQTFDISGYDARGNPIYEQNINLSGPQRAIFDQNQQQQYNTARAGNDLSGQIRNRGAFSYGPGTPKFASGVAGGPVQGQLNRAGLPALPTDLDQFRNEAEGALYDRNTAYLDKQTGRDEEALRTRLANQGVVEGSEAYSNAMDDSNRGKEMAYRQARNESIVGGGQEASRMFDIASQGRGQLYGEELGAGSFANQAQGQHFGQGMANANLTNAARGQSIAEQYQMRNQPINEMNALQGMNQMSMPQYQGTSQVGVAAPDYAGAEANNYNARMGSQNNWMSGLFGLGAAAIPFLSDENAKEDIHPVGELNDGTGLYLFRYKGDSEPHVGVMAGEVEKTVPDAVVMGKDGYRRVNYAKVIANSLRYH